MKDLRHVFFIGANKASIPLAIASRGGGHKDIRRSAGYTDYEAVFTSDHAEMLEAELGIHTSMDSSYDNRTQSLSVQGER
jgi:hypothetical protein